MATQVVVTCKHSIAAPLTRDLFKPDLLVLIHRLQLVKVLNVCEGQ